MLNLMQRFDLRRKQNETQTQGQFRFQPAKVQCSLQRFKTWMKLALNLCRVLFAQKRRQRGMLFCVSQTQCLYVKELPCSQVKALDFDVQEELSSFLPEFCTKSIVQENNSHNEIWFLPKDLTSEESSSALRSKTQSGARNLFQRVPVRGPGVSSGGDVMHANLVHARLTGGGGSRVGKTKHMALT